MTVTVELPEDIALRENPGRVALEKLVIDAFRADKISQHQGARMLGMDRWQFWDFMSTNELDFYTLEQLENDMATIRQFVAEGKLPR